jgi:CRISPR system Cascade subunit CasA
MAKFELHKQPWIPVLCIDGGQKEVSLTQAFAEAPQILYLSGNPLEVAAVTRFLLAICHLTETPTTLTRWSELWADRANFMKGCAEYVRKQGAVWNLFDRDHPFGQDPTLEKTLNPAHILVYEAARKNNPVLADHSIEREPVAIPAAKLARGLITTNAYAGSSGGGYRSGPLAMRTVGLVSGCTFAETLLLNVIVQDEPPPLFDWRSYGGVQSHAGPMDVVRRYLWTSRRVLLQPEFSGTSARTMLLAPGNEMPEDDRKDDPMVVMRKDAKGADLVPLRLEADRALWRWAHVLLSTNLDNHPMATLTQLSKLIRRDLISSDQPVSMRVCSVAGDAQGPSSDLWRDDTLPFGLSVVHDDARYAMLERAVDSAEESAQAVRRALYGFSLRYLQDRSDSAPDKADVARLLDELAPSLRDYWGALAPEGEHIASVTFDEDRWVEATGKAKSAAYRRAVDRLPPSARRFRAEYARLGRADTKKTKGANV